MLCSKCKQDKPKTDFYSNQSRVTGLSHYCKSCTSARDKSYYNRNSVVIKHKEIARGAGITVDQYINLKATYGDSCNICGVTTNVNDIALAYDHNHTTDKFRGFPCTNCNKGIGHFKDDPDLLRKAIKYLQRGDTWQKALANSEQPLDVI